MIIVVDIKLTWHNISSEWLSGGRLQFVCEFHIEAPAGDLPVRLTVTYPSGGSQTINGPTLIHDEGGPLGIKMPVTLDEATAGLYYVRLSVAGVELGDFPFSVDDAPS